MAAYATPITESDESISAEGNSGFLTRDEVMTAREVADLLRMPTSTVYELARRGGGFCGRVWKSCLLGEPGVVRPRRRGRPRERRGSRGRRAT